MPPFLFWFLAALSIVAALGVVVQRNPVHCLLALVLTLISIAVLFIGQEAVVVGFLQVIVYAGAIMVLFLFVIWLLNLPVETVSTSIDFEFLPSRMIEPLPKLRSIWESAASRAFDLSMEEPSTSRSAAEAISPTPI